MATAKKTSSGKFKIRIYNYTDDKGKKHYKSFTAKSKHEAELLASRYKSQKIHEDDLQTLENAIDEYIRLREAVLSPSTIKKYKEILKKLKEEFPNTMKKYCHNITKNDMQGLISALTSDRSPKTVKNYYGLITASNERIKAFNVVLPRIEQYEPYIPTEEQILTLLNYVKGKEIEVPVMLGAYCMMRRGEICGLSMNDINFKNSTIHIRHSLVLDSDRQWVNKVPKTKKSNRIIKIPDFVLQKIKEKGCITTYNPDTLTDRFEDILEELQLPHFRFHDLRHYACSMFAYRNVPLAYTQKYGGWSTLETLTRIYQHTLLDKEDEIFGKMNDYFSEKYDPKYDPTKRKA